MVTGLLSLGALALIYILTSWVTDPIIGYVLLGLIFILVAGAFINAGGDVFDAWQDLRKWLRLRSRGIV